MTVQAQADQVLTTQRQAAINRSVLWDVTDPVAAFGDLPACHRDGARAEWQLTEKHLQQRGLARAVGPEHRDELTGTHRQVEVVPQHAVAEGEAGALQLGDDVSSHDRSLSVRLWRFI